MTTRQPNARNELSPQRASKVGAMPIAIAALLTAALTTQIATAQSLDAARVTVDVPSRASAAMMASVEPPPASVVIDLGQYDGWLEELTDALRDHPSTTGLHRPISVEQTRDLAPELVWTDDDSPRTAFDVCSRGAQSVRARVAGSLPAATVVVIFDAEGENPRGGWTGADLAEDGTDGSWLPSQEGECLRVVVALPPGADASVVTLSNSRKPVHGWARKVEGLRAG